MSANDIGCPGGYWSDSGSLSTCLPVGEGFFSPSKNSSRFPCGPGTYSDIENATNCQLCAVGSYTDTSQSKSCTYCWQGSYTDQTGATTCRPCNDMFYDGLASDYAIVLSPHQTGLEQDEVFCIEPIEGPVFPQPTGLPTTLPPSIAPSSSTPTPTTWSPTLETVGADTNKPENPWPGTIFVTAVPTGAPSSVESSSLSSFPTLLVTPFPETPAIPSDPSSMTGRDNGSRNLSNYWFPVLLAIFLAIAIGFTAIWSYPVDKDSIQEEEEDYDDDDDKEEISSKDFDESSLADLPPYISGSVSKMFLDDDGIESQREEGKQRRRPTWYSDGESRNGTCTSLEIWSVADGLGCFNDDHDGIASYHSTDSRSNPLTDIETVHKN